MKYEGFLPNFDLQIIEDTQVVNGNRVKKSLDVDRGLAKMCTFRTSNVIYMT